MKYAIASIRMEYDIEKDMNNTKYKNLSYSRIYNVYIKLGVENIIHIKSTLSLCFFLDICFHFSHRILYSSSSIAVKKKRERAGYAISRLPSYISSLCLELN